MGETTSEEKADTRELTLEELTKLMVEHGRMRPEDAAAIDPNYNGDKEVRKLRKKLAKRDLGKPASEIIIEDRR